MACVLTQGINQTGEEGHPELLEVLTHEDVQDGVHAAVGDGDGGGQGHAQAEDGGRHGATTELQEVEGVVGAPAEEEGDDDGQDDLEGLLICPSKLHSDIFSSLKVSWTLLSSHSLSPLCLDCGARQ